MPPPAHTRFEDLATRRRALALGLALAAAGLGACGGGGSGEGGGNDDGAPAPSPDPVPAPAPLPAPGPVPDPLPDPAPSPSPAPAGLLAYRNGSVAALYRFDGGGELQFDAGIGPSLNIGIGLSRSRVVTLARERVAGEGFFGIALHRADGSLLAELPLQRELAFFTSAAVIDAGGTRIAVAVDEPASATDDRRIARTLLLGWPGGAVQGWIDGVDEPVWCDARGELLVRDPATGALRVFDAALREQPRVAGVRLGVRVGCYAVSADGRYLVYEDDDSSAYRLLAFDRDSARGWVLAEGGVRRMFSPAMSPDGRHVAVLSSAHVFYAPFVLPFDPSAPALQLDPAVHALAGTGIVNCTGRVAWAP